MTTIDNWLCPRMSIKELQSIFQGTRTSKYQCSMLIKASIRKQRPHGYWDYMHTPILVAISHSSWTLMPSRNMCHVDCSQKWPLQNTPCIWPPQSTTFFLENLGYSFLSGWESAIYVSRRFQCSPFIRSCHSSTFYQARQPADAGAENGVLSTYEVVCHIALRISIFVDLCSSLLFWTWFHHVSPRWFTIFAGQWFNGFWTLCLWMSFMISWLLNCGHVCFVSQHTYLFLYTYNISCFADFRIILCFFAAVFPIF